jgi:hypothetical protein
MRRRKKAVERALKEMMKNWTNEEKKNGKEDEEMEEEQNEPIRKRLKLEKGEKKWFKRPKVDLK